MGMQFKSIALVTLQITPLYIILIIIFIQFNHIHIHSIIFTNTHTHTNIHITYHHKRNAITKMLNVSFLLCPAAKLRALRSLTLTYAFTCQQESLHLHFLKMNTITLAHFSIPQGQKHYCVPSLLSYNSVSVNNTSCWCLLQTFSFVRHLFSGQRLPTVK